MMAHATTSHFRTFSEHMTDTAPPRTALITGASAGIGLALAEVFAKNGFNLILTARREDRLRALGADLKKRFGTETTVITADLSDVDAPQYLYDQVAAQGLTVDALVNNAGYGVPGFFANTEWESQADFIQVLTTAPVHLTRLFLPGMVERDYGRILNVASLNGLVPSSPGQSLYAGAKSFLIQFSQTLWIETAGTGVHVTALCPGFTWSEFHDVTNTRTAMNSVPKYMWQDAPSVARQGYEALMKNQPVCVTGLVNKVIAGLVKLLPSRLALFLVARQFSKIRTHKAHR